MSRSNSKPSLLWLYPGFLDKALDAATWLSVAQELRAQGWDVNLVCAGARGPKKIRGVDVTCLPMPDVYFFRQVIFHAWLYWLIWREGLRPDVVVFEQMSAIWLLLLRLVRIGRRPLFTIDLRSLHMPDPTRQSFKSRLRGIFQDMIGTSARHWVDGYTAISPRMAEAVSVPPDLLWGIWPSGVDLELFEQVPQTRKWPYENEPVRVIYLGVFAFERNLINLAKAVLQANIEGARFELWLVGSGDAAGELREIAGQSAGQIRVLAPVPHAQVPEILAQVHLGTLPFPDELKFQVSSPIKLFEYMAAGLPLMATRISCHTDVVADGKYAFWSETGSVDDLARALGKVWQERSNLADLGQLALKDAPLWSWRAAALKLSDALEAGLKRNPA